MFQKQKTELIKYNPIDFINEFQSDFSILGGESI